MLTVLNNEASHLCGPCGGACCKFIPGTYHPTDLGSSEAEILETVKRLLQSGDAQITSIDMLHTNSTSYIVRPAVVDATSYELNRYRTARCSKLTDQGCSIAFDSRPYGCRRLTPIKKDGKLRCKDGWTNQNAAKAWFRLADRIEDMLANEHEDHL